MQRPTLVAQKYACKEFLTPLHKGRGQFYSEVPLDPGPYRAICYCTGPNLPLSNIYFSNLLLVFLALLGNKKQPATLNSDIPEQSKCFLMRSKVLFHPFLLDSAVYCAPLLRLHTATALLPSFQGRRTATSFAAN